MKQTTRYWIYILSTSILLAILIIGSAIIGKQQIYAQPEKENLSDNCTSHIVVFYSADVPEITINSTIIKPEIPCDYPAQRINVIDHTTSGEIRIEDIKWGKINKT